MMFKRKGDKARYSFIDAKCIGRPCWSPGMYQHRSPLSGGGSRNTGSPDTPCCLNRAYRGCPEGPDGERMETCPNCKGTKLLSVGGDTFRCDNCLGHESWLVTGLPVYQIELAKERKAQGWKTA
jgi:hypothetical protein